MVVFGGRVVVVMVVVITAGCEVVFILTVNRSTGVGVDVSIEDGGMVLVV